ncbi:MAG: hypothetical protein K6L81_08325 [Agarilytica sp.]
MAEELYNIVFKGELVRSFELDAVKKNVGQLFKMQGPKLDALFSGKTIVLKRNLNFDAATKYRVAIKKAGARVDLMPVESAAEAAPDAPNPAKAQVGQGDAPAASAPRPMGKAVFGEQASSLDASTTAPGSSAAVAKPESPKEAVQALADESGFSLAPVGTSVLNESERSEQQSVDVDTSQLSLKEAAGDLLDTAEKRQYESLDVDLSGIDLAPEGAQVLNEDERPKVDALEVDVGDLSLAEPGARLGEPSPEPPPAPDVSGISLER